MAISAEASIPSNFKPPFATIFGCLFFSRLSKNDGRAYYN